MRLTYSEGFSLQEKKDARDIIFSNILIALKSTFDFEEMELRYTPEATSACI